MLSKSHSSPAGRLLTFCLQPNEGIVHTFLAKQPGPDICLRPVTMHFRYDLTFGISHPPSAYEWLFHDAMQGDQTLSLRARIGFARPGRLSTL